MQKTNVALPLPDEAEQAVCLAIGKVAVWDSSKLLL